MNEQKNSKLLNITLWIVQALLAVTFIWSGFMKLVSPSELPFPWIKDQPVLARITGVLDLLVGVGLILPAVFKGQRRLMIFSAYGIILLMLSAIIFHISRGEASVIGFNIFTLLASGFVIWGRNKLT